MSHLILHRYRTTYDYVTMPRGAVVRAVKSVCDGTRDLTFLCEVAPSLVDAFGHCLDEHDDVSRRADVINGGGGCVPCAENFDFVGALPDGSLVYLEKERTA